jgi:hypothetical protein
LAGSGGKKGEGRRPGAAGIAAVLRPGRNRGEERKEGEGEGDLQAGPTCQWERRKEKEDGGGVGRCGEGKAGCWVAGPKGKVVSFFSPFLFQTFFNTIFFKSNSNQNPSNFSQNFINLLYFTQATKNYAKLNNDAQTLVVSKLIKLN